MGKALADMKESIGLYVLSMGAFVGFAALTSGCVAEKCKNEKGQEATCVSTPVRYTDDAKYAQTLAVEYDSGTHLKIESVYGGITVQQGVSGEVSATFKPFAWGSRSQEAEAYDKIQNNLHMELFQDGDTIVARVTRDGSNDVPEVGADVQVLLPPEFDAGLVATDHSSGNWNPGDVNVAFVGNAQSVEVSAGSLSDCTVVGNAGVLYTSVTCDKDVRVSGVANDVALTSVSDLGSLTVDLASIDASAQGGRIVAAGDVNATFPASANFTVQAQSSARGRVNTDGVSPTCQISTAAETAKSLTCGAGGSTNYALASSGGNVVIGLR